MNDAPEPRSCLVLVDIYPSLSMVLLPEEVGLSLSAMSLAAGLIACLILDVIAPQEPLPYVPNTK